MNPKCLGKQCRPRSDCGASSEFVSSSIPSWQILAAHAQPFRGARDLAFCLKGPLDSLLVWASSGGSGETARMRRLAWTFAARIDNKYQIRLTRPRLICDIKLQLFIIMSEKIINFTMYNDISSYVQWYILLCKLNNTVVTIWWVPSIKYTKIRLYK